LLPFMPLPVVARSGEGEGARYRWLSEQDLPQSIGRLTGFNGNAGVLLRAYVYMRMLGSEGMSRVGDFATLNSNYLLARLQQAGFIAAYPRRRASHEFILTLKGLAQQQQVTAMDVAKRLLDFGFHAPTTYFPLLVPECLLIEPTSHTGRLPPDGSRVLIARDKPRGLSRMFRAFGASRKGLIGAFREEAAFRQELALAVFAVPLGLWLGRSGVERALLVAPMLLVLIVELLNSAIEAVVDQLSPERNELAALAKDVGSAAVLLSLVSGALVWVLVLLYR